MVWPEPARGASREPTPLRSAGGRQRAAVEARREERELCLTARKRWSHADSPQAAGSVLSIECKASPQELGATPIGAALKRRRLDGGSWAWCQHPTLSCPRAGHFRKCCCAGGQHAPVRSRCCPGVGSVGMATAPLLRSQRVWEKGEKSAAKQQVSFQMIGMPISCMCEGHNTAMIQPSSRLRERQRERQRKPEAPPA